MFIILISFDNFPMSFLPHVRVSEHCEYFYSWTGCEVKCSDKQDNDQDRCSGRHPSTERNVDIQWNMQLAGTGASARVVRREVCWTLHVHSPCIREERWRLSVTIWNVSMIMDGEKQRRYSVVLVWLTLETVNIGTLWESGTLDMDILHSVHTSPPCRAQIIAYIQYRSTTGKFVRERKIVENICSSWAEHSVVMVVNWIKYN